MKKFFIQSELEYVDDRSSFRLGEGEIVLLNNARGFQQRFVVKDLRNDTIVLSPKREPEAEDQILNKGLRKMKVGDSKVLAFWGLNKIKVRAGDKVTVTTKKGQQQALTVVQTLGPFLLLTK